MAMPEAALGAPDRRSMARLDFVLPDFTRHLWVSAELREVWEPRLQQAVAAWMDVEWRAVLAGVRRCGATIVSPDDFVAKAQEWAGHGLNALPVEMVGATGQSYSATATPPQPGAAFAYRVVVGAPADVVRFKQAWDAGDQAGIGSLLGYPPCCQEFFRRVWVDEQMVDTTWPMAAATEGRIDDGDTIELTGPLEANILGRWIGIRAVPHLPCSFDCEATVSLGRRLLAVGDDAGFGREMAWIREILSWPAEWSALHGIAEVKMPIVKISTRTDATARKYTVRRRSDTYPEGGVDGLTFPYRRPARQRITESRGFRRGLEQPLAIRPSWYATDNGFRSVRDMDAAHAPIVEAAVAALGGAGGRVLDLGCGNGALLEKIRAATEGVVPVGIDVQAEAIDHARQLHADAADGFVCGDLFDDGPIWGSDQRYRLALLMPGRLLEVDPERADRLRRRLRARCDDVLVYGYGDWLERYGGLAGLAAAAGVPVAATASTAVAAAVAAVAAVGPTAEAIG